MNKNESTMTAAPIDMEAAKREARRAYQKEWRRKNPDKVRANHDRFWAKKAAEMMAAAAEKEGEE